MEPVNAMVRVANFVENEKGRIVFKDIEGVDHWANPSMVMRAVTAMVETGAKDIVLEYDDAKDGAKRALVFKNAEDPQHLALVMPIMAAEDGGNVWAVIDLAKLGESKPTPKKEPAPKKEPKVDLDGKFGKPEPDKFGGKPIKKYGV